jgi:hypothetical protein
VEAARRVPPDRPFHRTLRDFCSNAHPVKQRTLDSPNAANQALSNRAHSLPLDDLPSHPPDLVVRTLHEPPLELDNLMDGLVGEELRRERLDERMKRGSSRRREEGEEVEGEERRVRGRGRESGAKGQREGECQSVGS